MICSNSKCKTELVPGALYCHMCGRKISAEKAVKGRGNGEGTVFKLSNGKYRATATTFYLDKEGIKRKKTKSKDFDKKKDAVAFLPTLAAQLAEAPVPTKKRNDNITFYELYEKWLPTHRAGKSTLDCYKAAFRYYKPIWHYRIADVDVDDLQECIDNCGKGKRTQQNMRTVCGLVYKYGIPRNTVPSNLNLAEFLTVGGEASAHRASFSIKEIEQIRSAAGRVAYADYIYSFIYLGFRPSEALALRVESYNAEERCFVGGAKTQAGINRHVTVSPKIQPYIDGIIGERTEGYVFCDVDGSAFKLRKFLDVFHNALDKIGIDNPVVEIAGGVQRRKYTPHTCRHTFATLMKQIDAPSKDKLSLIGHSDEEMLRYYQDINLEDLRRITDAI